MSSWENEKRGEELFWRVLLSRRAEKWGRRASENQGEKFNGRNCITLMGMFFLGAGEGRGGIITQEGGRRIAGTHPWVNEKGWEQVHRWRSWSQQHGRFSPLHRREDRQNWKGGAGKEREGEFLMAFVFSTKQEAGWSVENKNGERALKVGRERGKVWNSCLGEWMVWNNVARLPAITEVSVKSWIYREPRKHDWVFFLIKFSCRGVGRVVRKLESPGLGLGQVSTMKRERQRSQG